MTEKEKKFLSDIATSIELIESFNLVNFDTTFKAIKGRNR